MLFTEYEPHGLLFEIAEDPVWQTIPDNQLAGGLFRPRPTFDPPAPLAAGDGPAVRDAFKLATKARMAYLCAKATLTSDLLDSIGDINRESISDPLHGTSLLSPLAIRNAMTNAHAHYTQTDVDSLKLPLLNKLPSLQAFRPHCATFRLTLAALLLAGHEPLPLDSFNAFRASLQPFPEFQPYLVQFTIANPNIANHTFPALSAFLLPQLHNIISLSTSNPFAGSIQPSPTPHTSNRRRQPRGTPPNPPRDGGGPWGWWQPQRWGSGWGERKQPQPPPPNPSLPRRSAECPSPLHLYCYHHGWNTSHGWKG